MLVLQAPPTSSIRVWVADLGEAVTDDPSTAELMLFAADDPVAIANARSRGLRTIACLPVERPDRWHVAEGAERFAGIRADAYASCRHSLATALAHVRAEDLVARTTGPLRLTCLGGLGMLQHEPEPGATFPLAGQRNSIGRSPGSTVPIPQGHSDQSNVARLHAVVEVSDSAVIVRDAASGNGTYVGGRRIDEAPLAVGDEIAIAGAFRFRLDGAA